MIVGLLMLLVPIDKRGQARIKSGPSLNFILLLAAIILGPQLWAKQILNNLYSRTRDDFPGTGARHDAFSPPVP